MKYFRVNGKKNTCFFEDTFGLHKAGYVKKGIRIILAITFVLVEIISLTKMMRLLLKMIKNLNIIF